MSLITEHAHEAKKDARLKLQTDALMKRMADKATEALKLQAWKAPMTSINATVNCKSAISERLKAPATADLRLDRAVQWENHPGYFLATYTVDAENSFGAKLRNRFECQIMCLTEKACEVKKLYETR
jgi:hypothetical protein